MRLLFKSNIYIKEICRCFEYLTNNAALKPSDILYNEEKREVIFSFERYKIEKFKKRFFCFYEIPLYDKNSKISSTIIIKSIERCDIINLTKEKVSEIKILFGVKIDKEEIYFCSVEEEKGKNLFEMKLNINDYDIELKDN